MRRASIACAYAHSAGRHLRTGPPGPSAIAGRAVRPARSSSALARRRMRRSLRRLSEIHGTLRPSTAPAAPSRRPVLMTRNRILVVVALVVLLGGVGVYVAYDQVLSGDAIAPLALPSADPGDEPGGRGLDRHDRRRQPARHRRRRGHDPGGRCRHLDGRDRQPGRLPGSRAARPARRGERRGRADRPGLRQPHGRPFRGLGPGVRRHHRRRHLLDHLRQEPARQPAAHPGSRDRHVPDRLVQAHHAGRRAGGHLLGPSST